MVIKLLFFGAFGVFLLGVLWNLAQPYIMVWDLIKGQKENSRGVSVLPIVVLESFSLGVMAILGGLIEGEVPFFGERSVLLTAGAVWVLTLVHFFLIAVLGGIVASRFRSD